MTTSLRLLGCLFLLSTASGTTLEDVKAAGKLKCGTKQNNALFGYKSGSTIQGFDADYCRAVAAAVLGADGIDGKVQFVDAGSAAKRFVQLKQGLFDLLVRTTTHSIGRDTSLGVSFARPNFYDGQGFLVKAGNFITSLDDFDVEGSTYCVISGTTTEDHAAHHMKFAQAIQVDGEDELRSSLEAGVCKAITHDISTLATMEQEGDLIIADEAISREPLAAATRDSDEEWTEIVRWVTDGLVIAESLNITQDNVAAKAIQGSGLTGEGATLLRGPSSQLGVDLPDDFMVQVILAVGNYGEIYARHLEEKLPRANTMNDLWSTSPVGLQYPDSWNLMHGATPHQVEGSTYDRVKKGGALKCCTKQNNPLFGQLASGGKVTGFDADFCRAYAAAVFMDGTWDESRVEWVDASDASQRFDLLNSGACDVLVRTTTDTIGRDVGDFLTFARPNFYDGQGFVVQGSNSKGITNLATLDAEGNSVCVQQTTTTEQNLRNHLKNAVVVSVPTSSDMWAMYRNGSCDAATDDKSSLAALEQAGDALLDEVISREPLAATTRDNDEEWGDIVRWVTNGLVLAEYYNIKQADAVPIAQDEESEAFLPQDAEGRRLLGFDGFDAGLPMGGTFMRYALAAVGNYGEIYERNVEAKIPRANTQNALWTEPNGLQYAEAWTGASEYVPPDGPTLAAVRENGSLKCGTKFASPLFGQEAAGDVVGFDADYCRAVAAAVLGQPLVEFVNAQNAATRFVNLKDGMFDLLVRTSTHTLGRDVTLGVTFAPPNFYDGQAFMVKQSSGLKTLADLDQDGKKYCVIKGTSTLRHAQHEMKKATAVLVDYDSDLRTKLDAGECDAITADLSNLAELEGADDDIFETELISREPLCPATRDSDAEWVEVVRWVSHGLLLAEHYGITKANVESKMSDPQLPAEAARLLYMEPTDIGMNLSPTFMVDVIKAVGNYGEIYQTHVEAGIPRAGTENGLWTSDGGLQYPSAWNSKHGAYEHIVPGQTAQRVRERGVLNCCTKQSNKIFGLLTGGAVQGFDADYCRAIAAAVFEKADVDGTNKVNWVNADDASRRFNMLNHGDCDVLIRTTTDTIGRDVGDFCSFTRPNFFDGQGFLVKQSSGINSLDDDLDQEGKVVCVQATTSTEQNLRAYLKKATVRTVDSVAQMYSSLASGECDAATDDKSSLAAALESGLKILSETISREPLAVVVRDNDEAWFDVVNWVTNGLVLAEHLGITKASVDAGLVPDTMEGKRMLGHTNPELGNSFPLVPDFMKFVISSVGNYGEMYEKHVEAYIPRANTQNALHTQGGLQYSAPWTAEVVPNSPVTEDPSNFGNDDSDKKSMSTLALVLIIVGVLVVLCVVVGAIFRCQSKGTRYSKARNEDPGDDVNV